MEGKYRQVSAMGVVEAAESNKAINTATK